MTDSIPLPPLLAVDNLTVKCGNLTLVDHISFKVESGQTVALVGESGSGKSMTAHAIMRLLGPQFSFDPNSSICLNQKQLAFLPVSKMRSIWGKEISIVFQDPQSAFNPVLTIGEQMIECLPPEGAKEIVFESLRKVGLNEPDRIYSSYPHQISGGQKQRALIALSLLQKPKLLIADEPTTAIDAPQRLQLLQLLKELQQKENLAILLISHDLSLVEKIADQVCVMYASKIVEMGPAHEVLNHPKHPYTQALLEASPKNKRGKPLKAISGNIPAATNRPSGCLFHPRCPYAFERCSQEAPPLYPQNQQLSRCFLHDPSKTS